MFYCAKGYAAGVWGCRGAVSPQRVHNRVLVGVRLEDFEILHFTVPR